MKIRMTAPDLTVDDFPAGGPNLPRTTREMHSLPWSVITSSCTGTELFAKRVTAKTFDDGSRGEAQRPANNVYGYRLRPAQRQHDAVDQFLPQLAARSRRQGNISPMARRRSNHQDVSAPADKTAPPGSPVSTGWIDGVADAQGRAAMWIDGTAGPADPRSQCVARGRQGRLRPGAGRTERPVFRLATASAFPGEYEKEAAYLYCQWAVSSCGRAAVAKRRRVPFRNSVLNDEPCAGVKMPPEWLDPVIGSAKISKLGL
jgi:hypothetical protein